MRSKKAKRFLISLLGVLSLLIIPFTGYAAVPQTVNYQGYLTDSGGTPVDGTVQMTFKIYNVATGGIALWTETQSNVAVSDGIYSVVLGSVTPINLAFDTQYYLGVEVETDGEMTPRQALTSVPYAFMADDADTVDGKHASQLDQSAHVSRTDNPHMVTSTQVGALASIDGVSNDGGDVNLIPDKAIQITANDSANTITISEIHSDRTDNPHMVTASQVGAPGSIDGVTNDGGDIDMVQDNAITITPNDTANTITIGETHSARTDNPHSVTAAQVGAGDGHSLDAADGSPADAVYVDNDGNVGIGTTSPGAKLTVYSDTSSAIGKVRLQHSTVNSSTSGHVFDWTDTEGFSVARIGAVNYDHTKSYISLSTKHGGDISTDSQFRIDSNGNVGIGTANPQDLLHLYKNSVYTSGILMGNSLTGDGRAGLLVDYHFSGGAELWNFENTDMWFGTNNTRRMTIKNNGNVGIGTANPQSALQVNGYIQLALTSGIPPSADCDDASERGRMKVDNATGLLYICVDSGWVAK